MTMTVVIYVSIVVKIMFPQLKVLPELLLLAYMPRCIVLKALLSPHEQESIVRKTHIKNLIVITKSLGVFRVRRGRFRLVEVPQPAHVWVEKRGILTQIRAHNVNRHSNGF